MLRGISNSGFLTNHSFPSLSSWRNRCIHLNFSHFTLLNKLQQLHKNTDRCYTILTVDRSPIQLPLHWQLSSWLMTDDKSLVQWTSPNTAHNNYYTSNALWNTIGQFSDWLLADTRNSLNEHPSLSPGWVQDITPSKLPINTTIGSSRTITLLQYFHEN